MRSAEEGSTTALCQFEPYKPFVIAVAQGKKPAQNWKIAANLEKKTHRYSHMARTAVAIH